MRPAAVAAALLAAGILVTPATSASAQAVETVQYGEAAGVPLLMDVHHPPRGEGNGIGVLVIHGGRWMRGDRHETPAEMIAAEGFVAFAVDYRLAPEHPYPAAIEDLQTAVRFIRERAEEFGIDPAKIWAIGGSAGGHLAALLGTLGEGPTTEDARIAAAVSWSGPLDLEVLSASGRGLALAATQFVGCTGFRAPGCAERLREASPVTHLDPTDPPMFIANGTAEPIPFDQAIAGVRAAEQAGVNSVVWTVKGNVHGFSYVREVLPPTVAFVMNAIEGQDNTIDPPPTPDVVVPPVNPSVVDPVDDPPRDRAEPAESVRGDRATSWPIVAGIVALVAAAVIGVVVMTRGGGQRRSW